MSRVEIEGDFAEALVKHGEVPAFSELSNRQLYALRQSEWEKLEEVGGIDFKIRISEQNLR